MPITYEPIATTTLGSAAASITFSTIPATYTDLRLVLTFTTSLSCFPRLVFNGDTAGNGLYSYTILRGDGTTATSSRVTNSDQLQLHAAAVSTTIPSFISCDVFSYAGSTNKTILSTANQDYNGSGGVQSLVGLRLSTSALTSVTLSTSNTALYSIGTIATLYGIKNA